MKINRSVKALSVACILILSIAGVAVAAMAPLNPAFVEAQKELGVRNTATNPGGRMPSPVDMSHLAGVEYYPTVGKGAPFPTSYDLRPLGYVTPVRDQNPYGACWTFSAMASLESSALKAGVVTPDYAEQFLAYFGYIDQTIGSTTLPGFGNYTSANFPAIMDNGGDDFRAIALLARWTGAVDEANAPYGSTAPSPTATVSRHLQHVYYFYYDMTTRYQKASVDNIKTALMSYGAVSVGMYAGDPLGGAWGASPYFNATTYASYVPSTNPDGLKVGKANHAVTIVGWNDDYDRTNFNVLNQPTANGAWIVKNSWGASWGDGGYFYLSYEDAVLDTGAAYVGEVANNYDTIYQYDPFGWCGSYAPTGMADNTAWMANVFKAADDEQLKAVSFYAGGVSNDYSVYVYLDPTSNPTSGSLTEVTGGTITAPGYHTVTLGTPVNLAKDQVFSIVVKLKTPVYGYPVAVEYPLSGYSDKAVASAGQSYVSVNGTTWTDATSIQTNANICIKAFTSGGSVPMPPDPTPPTPTPTPVPTPSTGGGGGCNIGYAPALLLLGLPLIFLRK